MNWTQIPIFLFLSIALDMCNTRRGTRAVPPVITAGKDLPREQWFVQQLDHFKVQDTRTWKQRYWINWSYFKPGGPILLMIGGEGEENPAWLEGGAWLEYSKSLGAAMVVLEHRFYGKSRPLPDTSTKSLIYLSSRQALADLANFISTTKIHLRLEGKWVVIGGSYPGALAAWFRLKYPHLAAGAVSASGPLVAKADFPEYLEVVNEALETSSPGCSDAVEEAVAGVTQLLGSESGSLKASQLFNLCSPHNRSSSEDSATLLEGLLGNVESIVQYNKDNRKFSGGEWLNITTDTICDMMTADGLGDAITRFARVNSLSLQMAGETCLESRYEKKVSLIRRIDYPEFNSRIPGDVGNRPWFYQTCTEFGWYQSSDQQQNKPYGEKFPVSFFEKMCSDVFGQRYNPKLLASGIELTNREYGGRTAPVTNVVFVHGSLDPWHKLGRFEGSDTILVPGTAHCANLYPEAPEDPIELIEARAKIGEYIRHWVQ